LKEAVAGDVIATDLFVRDRLLLKSGTTLSARSISSLKEHDIETIPILDDPESDISDRNYIFIEDYNDKSLAEDLFFRTIEAIGYEYRYGKLLHNHKDVQYLLERFHHSFVPNGGGKLLYELAKHNPYSYYHSFDVFLLGTMAAKRLGFKHLDKLAEGYLYHAAAHLAVPQDLLQLSRRLTRFEKNLFHKSINEGNSVLGNSVLSSVLPYASAGKFGRESVPENHLLLLEIVRAYSTLTLSGPFKTVFPAQEAVQILFENVFDQELLIGFSQLLEVYPESSVVRLSDQSLAIVEHARFSTPAFPIIRRLAEQPASLAATKYTQLINQPSNKLASILSDIHNKPDHKFQNHMNKILSKTSHMETGIHSSSNNHTASFHLPLDFSLTIQEFVTYQPPVFEEHFDQFVEALIHNNKERAEQMLFILSGKKSLENLYSSLYVPAYIKLLNMIQTNILVEENLKESWELFRQLLPEIKELYEKEPRNFIGLMPESLALALLPFDEEQSIVSPLVQYLKEIQESIVLTVEKKKLILITEKKTQSQIAFKLLNDLLQMEGYEILLKDVQQVKFHDLAFAVSHGYNHLIIVGPEHLSHTNENSDKISQFAASLSGMNVTHYSLNSFNILLKKETNKLSLFDEIFHNIPY